MKDKEAWAIIGQFLVDFRQIAGMCWEGLESPSLPEKEDADKWEHWRKAERIKASLRKILDYIGGVTKKRPKLLWAGKGILVPDDAPGTPVQEWEQYTWLDSDDIIELRIGGHIVERPQGAYVIVIEKEQEE